MSWTAIQGKALANTVATFTSSATAGHLVVVCAASNIAPTSISDSASNTYTLAKTATPAGGFTVSVFYSVITTGGTLTITANGIGADPAIAIEEYSFTPGTISVSTNDSVGQSNAVATGNVTFSTYRALCIAGFAYEAAVSIAPNLGYTTRQQLEFEPGTSYGVGLIDNTAAISSPQNPGGTITTAPNWGAVGVAFSSTGDTGWVHVQGTNAAGNTATFGSAVGIGNLVVVTIGYGDGGTISGVSDTSGSNTYTQAVKQTISQGAAIYYCINASNTPLDITVAFTTAFPAIGIDEYQFTAGTISLPSTNTSTATNSAPSCGSVTFAAQPVLVVGVISNALTDVLTPTASYTLRNYVPFNNTVNYGFYSLEYLNAASSPQTPAGTWPTSTNWLGVSAVFKSSNDTDPLTGSTLPGNIYLGSTKRKLSVHY